jgi:hypothetical protein
MANKILSTDTTALLAILLAVVPVIAFVVAATTGVQISTLQYFWIALPVTWLGVIPCLIAIAAIGRHIFHVTE